MSLALESGVCGPISEERSPLRLAVYLADQNPHRDRSLGITSMTKSLLCDLCGRPDLILAQVVSRSSYSGRDSKLRTVRLPFRTDRTIGRLIADGFHSRLVRADADLWYYPKGYISRVSRTSVPTVGTMHDTIIQHYADHYPQSRSQRAFRYWIEQTKRSLARHVCVMTVSNHAAEQLRIFCQRHGIKPPPIKVTYEGSNWESHRGTNFEKRDYVVHLASEAPHKRSNTLLHMWRELQRKQVDLPRLLLVGKLNDEGKRLAEPIKDISLTPTLPPQQLCETVGSARALLLPSEIEGFGLPALEAYYVGTPVCYVNGTSVTEVVQDQDHRGAFVLDDPESFRTAVQNVLGMSTQQIDEIGDAMYERFAISRVGDRVVDIMRDCVARSGV